jgi:hypothetical protein
MELPHDSSQFAELPAQPRYLQRRRFIVHGGRVDPAMACCSPGGVPP